MLFHEHDACLIRLTIKVMARGDTQSPAATSWLSAHVKHTLVAFLEYPTSKVRCKGSLTNIQEKLLVFPEPFHFSGAAAPENSLDIGSSRRLIVPAYVCGGLDETIARLG
jgi:hypothetical protein